MIMNISARVFCCFFILISCLWSYSNGNKFSYFSDPKTEVSEKVAFDKLLNLESKVKSGIEYLIKSAIPFVVRQSSEVDLSEHCMASLMKTLLALKDMKLWAFQILDAIGKPSSGALLGGSAAMGAYHQCLSVQIPDANRNNQSKRPPQTGQYCIIRIRTPIPPRTKSVKWFNPVFQHFNATFKTEVMNEFGEILWSMYDMPGKIGICLPSACSEDDIRQLIESGASQIGIYANVEECELPEEIKMSTTQKSISSIYISIIIFCSVITLGLEVHKYLTKGIEAEKENYTRRIFQSFSLVENAMKLMKTRPAEKRTLDFMNGMRYLSATWVLLGHAYSLINTNQLSHVLNIRKLFDDFFLTVITGSFMSVDSFLFITGTLVAYNLVSAYDSKKVFNPIIAILRRMWRFLPTILVVTGIPFVIPLLTSGPEFKSFLNDAIEMCETQWWTNLLFVGNFVAPNRACVGFLWYLSADLQLFLYAMVYFFLLFRKPKYGQMFLGFGIFVGIISSGIVTYILELPPAALVNGANLKKSFDYVNYVITKPHVHLGNYSIGLFLGTYLARNKDTNVTRFQALIGWTGAIGLGLTSVYGVYPWFFSHNYTMVEAITFSASQRTIWGLAIAWLSYACFIGKGGYINDFLSWPGFQPLVKLSFQLYVVHIVVQLIYWYTRQGPLEVTNSTFVYSFFGTLCVSHIFSLMMRLFVEAPGIELERIFCSWLFGSSKSKKDELETAHQLQEKYTPNEPTNEKIGEENVGFRL